MTAGKPSADPDRSIKKYMLAAAATLVLLVGGMGGLSAMTELSGAVIAQGTLVVDSNVKKVQHPTGGVVGAINVREGDNVRAGDVLVRLDETVTKANLAIVAKSLDELRARLARLEAERDGKDGVRFPEDLLARRDDTGVAGILAGETSLFALRRDARHGQKSQLRERISQLAEETAGLNEQKTAKTREIELIGRELESIRTLWQSKLVSLDRLTALERDATRLTGEHGQLISAIAQTKGRSSEIELQIIQVDQDLRSEVAGELREVQARIAELVERKVAAEDQLKRIDIRSPQNGIVHQLMIHTIGGVITAGEPIMMIVPVSDESTVEARIAPQDIDQVAHGQKALVRLSAFNQQTTPELIGLVAKVAADLTVDQKSGAEYYSARIQLPKEEVSKLGDLSLAAGMPAEVFLQTRERTVLSYLVEPLSDQMNRAFRED
ncbi:HlyD family type I secretion periplasmic adaptor subunit [Taklimakanibacter deserti]|uniref:HlyD family type I secretion periplasmic adaptor subunit n=1 Tax=Taklimakanibacter deserti TaxID=2267839 RepID=UPI000E65D5F9